MTNVAHRTSLASKDGSTIISIIASIAGPLPSRLATGGLGKDVYIYCNYDAIAKEVKEKGLVMEEDYDYYEGCLFHYLQSIFTGKSRTEIFNALFNAMPVPVFRGFDLDVLSKDLYIYFNYDVATSEYAKKRTFLEDKQYYMQHICVFFKYIFVGKTPLDISTFLSLLDHFH